MFISFLPSFSFANLSHYAWTAFIWITLSFFSFVYVRWQKWVYWGYVLGQWLPIHLLSSMVNFYVGISQTISVSVTSLKVKIQIVIKVYFLKYYCWLQSWLYYLSVHTNLGLISHKGQGSQEVGRCVEILVVRYCLRFCNFSIKLGTKIAAVYARVLCWPLKKVKDHKRL